jgi:hypothetical protein
MSAASGTQHFKTPAGAVERYCRLLGTQDVFYAQKVLFSSAGEMEESSSPAGFQMKMNIEQIVKAARQGLCKVPMLCHWFKHRFQ